MAKGKIRVYQLARELGITSKEALAKLRDLGHRVEQPLEFCHPGGGSAVGGCP